MSYRVVTVSPLKQFPIAYFGLANVASLDDAKNQICEKYKKMAEMRIEADDIKANINGGQMLNADGRAGTFLHYKRIAEQAIEALEERWSKLELSLKFHLERQERRLAHFKTTCRLKGCDNPHPLGTAYSSTNRVLGRKVYRHNAPLFCGAHAYLRRAISAEAKKELIASSSKRLVVS